MTHERLRRFPATELVRTDPLGKRVHRGNGITTALRIVAGLSAFTGNLLPCFFFPFFSPLESVLDRGG